MTLLQRLMIGTAALIVVVVLFHGCADNTLVSEGDRVGIVTKLSHKRMTCIGSAGWNWEGELSMQGGTTAAGQGVSSDGNFGTNHSIVGVWQFSLDPNAKDKDTEQIVDRLRQAMNSGHTIRVQYRQVANHDDCRTATDYLVVDTTDLTNIQK